MREIQIKKNYEEIKIGGDVFKLSLSYETITNCKKELTNIAQILGDQDTEQEEQLIQLSKTFIDGIFIDKPFDTMMTLCENDMFAIFDIMVEVVKILEEKSKEIAKRMKPIKPK